MHVTKYIDLSNLRDHMLVEWARVGCQSASAISSAWEYIYLKSAELGSLGLHQTGCAIALGSIKGRAGDGR